MNIIFGEGCCDGDYDFVEENLEWENYKHFEKSGDLLIIDTRRAWHTIRDTAVYIMKSITGEKNLPSRREFVRPYRFSETKHKSLF